MTAPISFDPFLSWVDTTDPDNIPVDVRIIGASDLLRYENFGVAAAAAVNSVILDVAATNDDVTTVDGRVDGLVTRIDDVDTRIDGVETSFAASLAAEAGRETLVRKVNDTTRTATTTLANDPELTVTLGSYEAVELTAVLFVTSPTTADIKVSISGTGVAAGRWGVNNSAVGWHPDGIAVAVTTTGVQQMFVIHGIIGVGEAGGVCALQWAQYISDAGVTTVHSFSYLKTRNISGG